MTDILIGAVLLAVGAALIFAGLPDKDHESPRFLRFHAATVVFPPLVLTFLVGGGAELLTGLSQIQ
jgi:hypothetical protein